MKRIDQIGFVSPAGLASAYGGRTAMFRTEPVGVYTIPIYRGPVESAASDQIGALQERLNIADQRVDDLEAERTLLRSQVATLQSDANSWQSGYDRGRSMAHKGEHGRLAGFWRSPAEIPAAGLVVVVLRDAGTVGNGQHPGHRSGRWLELTTTCRRAFACDMISTGSVIGWVGIEEFQRWPSPQQ
jgi:hypothetical protein